MCSIMKLFVYTTLIVALNCGVSDAQCFGRTRASPTTAIKYISPTAPAVPEDYDYYENLIELVNIINRLQNKVSNREEKRINTEEIINKLVNALILATTQNRFANNNSCGGGGTDLLNVALGNTELLNLGLGGNGGLVDLGLL